MFVSGYKEKGNHFLERILHSVGNLLGGKRRKRTKNEQMSLEDEMELRRKKVMVLGGFGEVGFAICRQLLDESPRELIVTSLKKDEALGAVEKLRTEAGGTVKLTPVHGNLFVRWSLRDIPGNVLQSTPKYQKWLAEDSLEELSEEILNASTLFRVIKRHKPEIIIDCINTATAMAYQNVYQSYKEISRALQTPQDVEGLTRSIYHLLSTVCIPPLIRHFQILNEAMRRNGTRLYLKIGTTGTGGMGLNIPFTHGEEQPSRLLLSKAAVAGAHTLLLFLLSRTPGAPVIREIKPAALIGWKGIGRGRILRGGVSIPLYDCPPAEGYKLVRGKLFDSREIKKGRRIGGSELKGVYVDTGENGLFSPDEFKVVTTLGLMEYVTPEEIAHKTVQEIRGVSTSKDVLGAITGAIMGATYRAGLLRQRVMRATAELKQEGFAYGLLGPKVAKLITEAQLFKRCYGTLGRALRPSAAALSQNLKKEIERNRDIRSAAISLGLPILLPDGETLLFATRPRPDKSWEESPFRITRESIEKWASQEWIDLRPQNMSRWRKRFKGIMDESGTSSEDTSSRFDHGRRFWERTKTGEIVIDPGEIVGWLLIKETGGRA